jgi:hypothetical protein
MFVIVQAGETPEKLVDKTKLQRAKVQTAPEAKGTRRLRQGDPELPKLSEVSEVWKTCSG